MVRLALRRLALLGPLRLLVGLLAHLAGRHRCVGMSVSVWDGDVVTSEDESKRNGVSVGKKPNLSLGCSQSE